MNNVETSLPDAIEERKLINSERNLKASAIPDSRNRRYFESPGIAEFFEAYKTDLFKAEEVTLKAFSHELQDQPLLEIGIGGGRITPYLMAVSTRYIGIDYSGKMVDLCRQRFNDANLQVCDATSMSCFDNERFAAVIFWGNGIDEVSLSDRNMILKEAHRVLRKNGIFLLSSRNFEWSRIAWSCAFDDLSWADWYRGLTPSRLRIYGACALIRLRAWISGSGCAAFPELEVSPEMVVPRYFIKKETQERHLLDAGFTQVKAMALDGNPVDDRSRRQDVMVFYSARKP